MFLGAPGVGKSTFAHKIAPMFGLSVFINLAIFLSLPLCFHCFLVDG